MYNELAKDLLLDDYESLRKGGAFALVSMDHREESNSILVFRSAKDLEAFLNNPKKTVGGDETAAFSVLPNGPGVASALEFDHVFPPSSSSSSPAIRAILFADIAAPGTTSFELFHKVLKEKASQPAPAAIQYIFRHLCSSESQDKISLQGYGAELQIKNMEYSAIDKNGNLAFFPQFFFLIKNSRINKQSR